MDKYLGFWSILPIVVGLLFVVYMAMLGIDAIAANIHVTTHGLV